jgi:signal transduction histidine kinase
MNPTELFNFLPLLVAVGYTVLLIVSFVWRSRQEEQTRWLLAFLVTSIAWEFFLFLAPELRLPRHFALNILLVGTTFLGMSTAVYVEWPQARQWILLGTTAVAVTFLTDIFLPEQTLVVSAIDATVTYNSLIAFLAWMVLSSYIFLKTWRDYRRTEFPWHANRLLFWVIALLLIFAGEALLFFLWTGLTIAGQVMRLLGVLALIYAAASYRIFDVRTRTQRTLASVLVTLISALPMAGLLLLVPFLVREFELPSSATIFLTLAVVLVGFFFYQPFRNLVQRRVYHFLLGEGFDTGRVLRNYSQATSRTLDVNELSLVVIGTISELMETNRGALLLLTEDENGFILETIPAMGNVPRQPTHFSSDSHFIHTLRQQHQPLLQYELDFNPEHAALSSEERDWLKRMGMEVYVPISTDEELDGLIAIGPKQSGVPYQPDELELMQTLGDQTVIALQNARLYSELGNQNEKIRQLNLDLVGQNEHLEIIDRVKSDFITIASHELRTPLTQVKGYTDILASMNDESILTEDQTREIVGHINRATLQLEGLITAMLDASQLDVEGMQLTFMQTSLDTIVRLALEPLGPAAQDRRIQIDVDGIVDLPPIQADFKRLVQAFHNVIGNAIKYTPDHGRITIVGRELPVVDGEREQVEVVITDSGIGIDSQYHELIFEKFFRIGDPQLHSTGSTKFKGAGPGLGLPIAKGVIEAHEGRIWVESDGEDEERLPGAEVHIILPLIPPDAPAATEAAPQEPQMAQERPSYLIG